jgi:hypothetical protein
LPQGKGAIGVSNKFSNVFHPEYAEEIPEDLIGAEIVNFGAPVGGSFDGGGLVIDYRPKGCDEIKRLILDFNESGMWSVYNGISVGQSE